MPDAGCLIIDDVEAALGFATIAGRAVLREPAASVRDAVLRFAHRCGWTIVSYHSYMKWAEETRTGDGGVWVVADPLFPCAEQDQSLAPVRLTRSSAASTGFRTAARPGTTQIAGGTLGIIDDAVSSGRTLGQLIRDSQALGATVSRVLVCGSSRLARSALVASQRGLRWQDFIPGDWRIVHLRDGCPHLPYSARPSAHADIVSSHDERVEVRIQSTAIPGNLWQVMWLDREIRAAILSARRDVASGLSAMLNRTAVVRDLTRLGHFVPVLCTGDETITGDTTLASLVPES